MRECRQKGYHWFHRLLAITLIFSLLSACATSKSTLPVQETATPPLPPARDTGHVVNIKKNLPVRMDTSLKSKQLGQLKLGDSVYINEEKDNLENLDWYHITSITDKNGQPLEGWVVKQYVEKDPVAPSPPPPSNTTQETDQLQEGSKDTTGMKLRTTAEGAVLGASVGAALGALTAFLTGGNVGKGAIIGAAGGGAAGLVAGVYVANQKDKFATEEAYLDACAREAAQYNEEARKANEYLSGYVSDMQLRVKELQAQIRKNKAKKQLAKDELETLTTKKQGIDEMITKLQDEVKAQNGALSSVKKSSSGSSKLQQEVATTQQEIEKLKRQREELVNLTTKMNDLSV